MAQSRALGERIGRLRIPPTALGAAAQWNDEQLKSALVDVCALVTRHVAKAGDLAAGKVDAGDVGENLVRDILAAWSPEDTSGKAHMGDLHIRVRVGGRERLIMVEVKNWGGGVTKENRDRFLQDLRTSAADAGLFIAVRGGIATQVEPVRFTMEQIGGRAIPVARVASPSPEMITTALRALEFRLGGVDALEGGTVPIGIKQAIARLQDDLRLLKEEHDRRVRYLTEEMAMLNVRLTPP